MARNHRSRGASWRKEDVFFHVCWEVWSSQISKKPSPTTLPETNSQTSPPENMVGFPKGEMHHLPIPKGNSSSIHQKTSGAKNVTFREGNGLKFWKFLLLERPSIQTFLYIGAPAIPTIWRTSCWRHRLNLPCKRFPFVSKFMDISVSDLPPPTKSVYHVDM